MVSFNLEVFHFQQAALTSAQRCCFVFFLFFFVFSVLFFGRDQTMMMLTGVVLRQRTVSLARLVMPPVLSR